MHKYDSAESDFNKHFKIRMFVCYIWLDCYNIDTKKLYYKLKFKLLKFADIFYTFSQHFKFWTIMIC